MTYQEFLSALRNTPREWFLKKGGAIRSKQCSTICPGLAVGAFGIVRGMDNGLSFSLGSSMKECLKIATAADREPECDPQIRADLLSACGLAEAN